MAKHPSVQENQTEALSATNLSQIAVLEAARNPRLGWQALFSAIAESPANSEVGHLTHDVSWATLAVQMRRDASTKQTDVSVNTITDSFLYRVSLNGTNLDFTSGVGTTEAKILTGVALAVDGGAEPVGASVVDGVVVVVGDDDTEYTITVSAELTIDREDGSALTVKLWGKLKDDDDPTRPWFDLDGVVVSFAHNVISRINVSGLSAVYAQPTAITGSMRVGFGLCGITTQDGIWTP